VSLYDRTVLIEATEVLPDDATKYLKRSVGSYLKKFGYDLKILGKPKLAANRLSWTAQLYTTADDLPHGRYVFHVGRPNKVSPWAVELTYARSSNAEPQRVLLGSSPKSVAAAFKAMKEKIKLKGLKPVPKKLRVGSKVRGNYKGQDFTGKIGKAPVNGINIKLDKAITVFSAARTSLWFDPKGGVFGKDWFELAESLEEYAGYGGARGAQFRMPANTARASDATVGTKDMTPELLKKRKREQDMRDDVRARLRILAIEGRRPLKTLDGDN
jgi:hypothetical protein